MSMLRAADITCRTDTGRQRRDNEDSAYARAPLFVVADGMGGAQAGEVASRIAIETFEHGLPEGASAEQRLADRVREANRAIYERSRAERERQGMGTTLTAAYLEETSLAIAHVGDSRAYLLRDGRLQRLTRDHSLVDELVRRGKLTEAQAAEHPQRSIITRALGPEPDVEVDTWSYPVRANDVLLLCSDGLTSMVSEEEVERILAEAPALAAAGDELIAAANAAGGRDNITVVLFRVEDAGGTPADGATLTGMAAASAGSSAGTGSRASTGSSAGTGSRASTGTSASTAAIASPTGTATQAPAPPLRPRMYPARPGEPRPGLDRPILRPPRRFHKPVAALIAVLVVLFMVGSAGYLATRELFFIGTNADGVVTIYRGLPYDLPVGIHLYETYYVSGVPASLIPPDRRASLLNNQLRSQTAATNLVRALELGKIQP